MTGLARLSDRPSTAVILAGGLGTRLQSRSSGIPKVLVQAAGKPFLGYLLSYLASQEIKQVILSTGYLAEQVRGFASDGSRWGLEIRYVTETEPLGTGGALRLASQNLQSPFFALNGDTLFQIYLSDLWSCHKKAKSRATVALRQADPLSQEAQQRGFVLLDQNNHILSFAEKPGTNRAAHESRAASWTNGGIYVFEPDAFDDVEGEKNISLEREIFPAWVNSGDLTGCPLSGYFIDIGTPQSLDRFEQDIQKRVFTETSQAKLADGG